MSDPINEPSLAEEKPVQYVELDLDSPVVLVDTVPRLASLLSDISARALPSTSSSPTIFIDLEGIDLCRDGQLCIIQMYIPPLDKTTFLIDVHTLGALAFDTPASEDTPPSSPDSSTSADEEGGTTTTKSRRTLRDVLTDPTISKCLYDVRNDSDALYNLWKIDMPAEGIIDLQLMELATRKRSKKHLSGLAKAVDKDLLLDEERKPRWADMKKKGKEMFESDPTIAGKRPIPAEFLEYCVQDVLVLPHLFALYNAKLSRKWRVKVENEVFWRLQLARQEMYYGKGEGNICIELIFEAEFSSHTGGNMHLGPW
jgi:exonuclease 3'-5' domain-containing protein 1